MGLYDTFLIVSCLRCSVHDSLHATLLRTSDPITPMQDFHPLIAEWFCGRFARPTACQLDAGPLIRARRDVLVSAPTGSGKTLAAFLVCLDRLVADTATGRLTAGLLPFRVTGCATSSPVYFSVSRPVSWRSSLRARSNRNRRRLGFRHQSRCQSGPTSRFSHPTPSRDG